MATKAVTPSKPVHAITIFAEAPEAARLKRITSVLPNSHIEIVGASGQHGADFLVSTKLDQSPAGQSAKLFTEELHIVAGPTVHSVADLKGKVVSFGPLDGPTQGASRKAFDALAIKVKETPLDFDNAFDGLATGDLDAVVILAPQPSERLKRLDAPGLHLVSWPENGARPAGSTAVLIRPTSYPGLSHPSETVRAVGVDAVLNMSAVGAKQPAARAFLVSLSQHSAALSRRGFDLLKADLEARSDRRIASADKR